MPAPRMTIDQLPTDTALAGTEWLIVQDAGTSKKVAVSTVTSINQSALTAHIDAVADAHDATAISTVVSGTGVDGASVQAQLGQLATIANANSNNVATNTANIATNTTDIAAHVGDTVGAHAATAISVGSIAGVVGTEVQAVLAELAARIVVLETT